MARPKGKAPRTIVRAATQESLLNICQRALLGDIECQKLLVATAGRETVERILGQAAK